MPRPALQEVGIAVSTRTVKNCPQAQTVLTAGLPRILCKTDWAMNTLRPRQNGSNFQTAFSNAFSWMTIYEFRLRSSFLWSIYNIPALVQIIAWRRSDDNPLSAPMMVSLLRRTCVTRPQWVNAFEYAFNYQNRSKWTKKVNQRYHGTSLYGRTSRGWSQS